MAAIFGFQIVLTLVAASILQKLSPRYSIGRWLLCRKLYHYLHPSNEELKAALAQNVGPVKATKKKAKPDKRSQEKPEIFSLPKQTDIQLISVPVTSLDVLQLPHYVDFRWLIDFTCYASIVYLIGEIFAFVFPTYSAKEMNLSLIWIFVSLMLSLKSLAIVTALYFRGSSVSGERSVCLCFGAVCFLITMTLFLASDNLLDIGLLEAHRNFTLTTTALLQTHDLPLPKVRSPILLYLLLSLMFGFLASFLAFPCLRYSRMYNDALRYSSDSAWQKFLIHATFFAPLFVLLLWIRPLAHDQLIYGENAIFTLEQFESVRLWISFAPVILRVATCHLHLQSYLNLAFDKVKEMRNEGGRITNVDLQKMVAQIFYYLCIVAMQYFAPVALIFSLNCVLKTLGEYRWTAVISAEFVNNYLKSFNEYVDISEFVAKFSYLTHNATAEHLSATGKLVAPSLYHLKTIFNVTVNRGVWNFFLFATSFINFFGSLLGVVYVTKFSN